MPQRPDVPCSVCGKLMWRGSTSLPEGQATCLPCRRSATTYKPQWSGPKPTEVRCCQRCRRIFETNIKTQVYCSAECRGRGKRGKSKPKNSSARGYGYRHQLARAKWAKVVATGQAACCLCGDPINPTGPWHLDHQPGTDQYRGPAHVGCNTRDGAKRRWQNTPGAPRKI